MRVYAWLLHGGILAAGEPGSRCAAFAPLLPPRIAPAAPRRAGSGGAGFRARGGQGRALATAAVAAGAEAALSALTVAELKERLRALHLAVGGRKQDLINRLHDHDALRSALESETGTQEGEESEREDEHGSRVGADSLDAARAKGASTKHLQSLTVPALKERLREVGYPVGGRKAELIERLTVAMGEQDGNIQHMENDRDDTMSMAPEMDDSDSSAAMGKDADDSDSSSVMGNEKDSSLLNDEDFSLVNSLEDILGDGGEDEEAETLEGSLDDGTSRDGEDVESATPEIDVPDSSSARGDTKDSSLLNMLDDILSGMEGDRDEDTPTGSSDDGIFRGSDAETSTGDKETPARRAKKKKYWKSQDVRELVRSGDPRAAAKAEEMITALETMADKEDDAHYLPGPEQYTLLIEAYAKSGTAAALRKAEAVIERVLNPPDDGAAGRATAVPPTAPLLNAMIAAYATAGDVGAAQKATILLDRMAYLKKFGGTVKPTVISYAVAISAWAKCGSRIAAEEAEIILRQLLDDYDEVLRSEGPSGDAEELKPNNIVFNSVIDAWAQSGSPDAGEKAVALLHRMEVLSRTDEYDVRPDTISFNTCIKAFCNSKRTDAAYKAEEILAKLEMSPQYPKRNGGALIVRPNRLSYNTVINSWARSTLPEAAMRAEDVLLRMIKAFKSETFATISPDAVTFASVLNALAKSKTVRFKAEKCGALLQSMVELHEDDHSSDTKPNIICYNTVLNACAFSAEGTAEERRRAMKVAVDTFQQMRRGDYVAPDAVSYGNLLKCCANLMPPGERRNGMASQLFHKCCEEGVVGGMCLDEIRRCVPPRAFLPLLADCGYDGPMGQRRKAHSVELQELPRSWTKHVKRGDMASRQRASFKPEKQPRQERRTRRGDQERRTQRQRATVAPVIRRPGSLVEYGSSMKDM